jgi:hypothetical protein
VAHATKYASKGIGMSTSERKEWRRSFTETIMELANGRVDILEAASWAMEAQHLQGYRDAKEVAGEQFRNVDIAALAASVPARTSSMGTSGEFLLTRPDQSRLDAGAP